MKQKLKLLNNRYFLVVVIIFIVAFVFGLKNLIFQTIFGYDMARDAYEAYSILPNLKAKILGPGTDIPGLNHGVLWFYILSLPYFISRQDPQFAVIPFYILSFASIPFVWLLSQKLFNNKTISLVSVILYSFSPFFQSFSIWLSNPITGLYVAPVLLYLLWIYLEKRGVKYAAWLGGLFGMLVQANLANLLFCILIPIYLLVFRIKPTLKEIFGFFALFGIVVSSYFIAEIKFGGRGINALMAFLKEGHSGNSNKLVEITTKIAELFEISVFPFPKIVVYLLLILFVGVLILKFKKYKKPILFLLIWIFNIVLFKYFSTGISTSSFLFLPTIASAIILLSFVVFELFKNRYIIGLVVLILVSFQIATGLDWLTKEYNPAAIQKSNNIYRYKQVVDYTYQNAQGKPFTIISITTPLFINTTWSYLYEFYGKNTYGYAPYFGGRSQEAYLGNLVEKQFATPIRYLIIESTIGLPYIYIDKLKYEEEKVSDLIEERKFGHVIVQKRKFHEGKPAIPIPEELKNSHVLYD